MIKLKLTKANLQEWKKELDRECIRRKLGYKLSETASDKDWLTDWLGDTPHDVVCDEIYYSMHEDG